MFHLAFGHFIVSILQLHIDHDICTTDMDSVLNMLQGHYVDIYPHLNARTNVDLISVQTFLRS